MAASEYTVLNSKALAVLVDPHTTSEPFGRTATAVLPDNTLLLGVWYETDNVVRVWHLSFPDLDILGQVDLPGHVFAGGGGGDSPVMVVLSGTSVLVVSQYSYRDSCYSWVLDCSGATPVVTASHVDSTANMSGYASYRVGEPLGYYNPATNVAVVGCYDVRTFIDGAMVGYHSVGSNPLLGWWPDPADANKLTAVDDNGVVHGFQIDAAGAITTFTPALPSPPTGFDYYNDWIQGVGDPFDPNSGFVTETWFPDSNAPARDNGSSPTLLFNQWNGTRTPGPFLPEYTVAEFASCRLDQRLAMFGNVRDNATATTSQMRLQAMNWSAGPATVEWQDLTIAPYIDPNNTDTLSAGGPSIAGNTNSGAMIAACTFVTDVSPYLYSLIVWSIQGPGNAPNLTAALRGVEVHFTA